MVAYLFRRLISGLVVLFLYVSLLFFVIQLLLPGDYVSQFALFLTTEESQEARQLLGLETPIFQRYLIWVSNLLRGDLGVSFDFRGAGAPVSELIADVLPATLLVFGIGTALAFMLGLWLGKSIAWRGGGLFSSLTTFGGIALYTSFPPWLGFLLVYFVASRIGLPLFGLTTDLRFTTPDIQLPEVIWKMVISLSAISLVLWLASTSLFRWRRIRIHGVLAFLIISAGWVGNWYLLDIEELAPEILHRAALPILMYILLSFGEIMLIMRTSMMDVRYEEYVWAARAKGLPEKIIRDRHAARNAILPVISRFVTSIPFLLAGMVMIEQVLQWSGVGSMLFYAVGRQNVTLALGMVIIIGVISLSLRLVLDVLQLALDPRIRVSSFK